MNIFTTIGHLIAFILIHQLVNSCDTDIDCKTEEFCVKGNCQQCFNCENFNRELLPQINCSKDVLVDCGNCLSGYEDVADLYKNESLTEGKCELKSSNESLINDDVQTKSSNGWIVFGFAILGALVGFILGGLATVGMSMFYNKRRTKHAKSLKKIDISDSSSSKLRTGTLNSNEENSLLTNFNDEKKGTRSYHFKECSTFKPL